MEEKIKNLMRFYLLATQLKNKIRSGWNEQHWNIKKERIESVAEHVYGTCILALSIYSEFDFELDIDINKVLKMMILHEIGEVIIGDITPYDNITPEEKMRMEHEAILIILEGIIKKEEYYSLLIEFDEKQTKEAIFAFHCDKLEADIQSKIYQDTECHNNLEDISISNIIKNKKINDLILKGAKTPFDIWYETDKKYYENDKIFASILEYVKENNTSIEI